MPFSKCEYLIHIVKQFQNEPKLGGNELIKPFADKLIEEIKNKFMYFEHENDQNRNSFHVSILRLIIFRQNS